MAFRWSYSDAAGAGVPGPEIDFDEQAAAEDWLGENWPALLQAGVEQVSLLDGTEPVYGPMSLRPADS